MESASSRSGILQRIRSALQVKEEVTGRAFEEEQNFFAAESGSSAEIFERSFKRLQGNFISCESLKAVPGYLMQLPPALLKMRWCSKVPEFAALIQASGLLFTDDILQAEVVVTDCECLVARTGSVVLSAAQASGRALPVYAPVHITIATAAQLLYDTDNAIAFLMDKYAQQLPSSLYFIAGPSRTGDIEKTLVMGVHGPKEVFVLLITKY